jgi:hypothetical protein
LLLDVVFFALPPQTPKKQRAEKHGSEKRDNIG